MKIESTIYNFITPEDKEFIEILKNNKFKNLEIFLVGGALRDILTNYSKGIRFLHKWRN